MNQAQKTPVALFIYNRPHYARSALESLSRCRRVHECQLFLFCDGAKTPDQEEKVAAARQAIRPLANELNAQIIERSQNLGLSRSVIEGVGMLCRQYGQAIVVEDDLVLHPSFLDYMLNALERYKDIQRVAQISGYMFPVKHPPQPDAFFLPLTTTWGWATWQRVWEKIRWDTAAPAEDLASPLFCKSFNLDGAYPFSTILQDRLEGRNDSWGILFWYNIFKSGQLVLYPRTSLTWLGGLDRSGTHFSTAQDYNPAALDRSLNKPRDKIINQPFGSPFSLPEAVEVNEAAFNRVLQYLRTQQTSTARSQISNRVRNFHSLWKNRSEISLWAHIKRKFFSWLDSQIRQNRHPPAWQAIIAPTARIEAEASIENIAGGKERVVIGEHSVVRGRLLIYGHGGKVRIGDWCYIGVRSEIWSMESIEIGNRVLISHDVNIHDGSAHSLDAVERHHHFRQIVEKGHPRNKAELPGVTSAPIIIEDDVWISFGVTILKGVRIGRGSVIAAGSTVTRDVPPYTLYRCEVKPILQPIREANE